MIDTTALPSPDQTDAEILALFQHVREIIAKEEESDLTHLVVYLCALITAQRVAMIEKDAKTPEVATRLIDAFLDGVDEARA